MSIEFLFRVIGMIILSIVGARFGVLNAEPLSLPEDASGLIFSLVGALTGLILTPWFTTYPAKSFRKTLTETPIVMVLASMVGLLFGLVVAILIAYPLSLLPDLLGIYMPLVAVFVSAYFGIFLFYQRAFDIFALFRIGLPPGALNLSGELLPNEIIIDTSVIIDGRILEISKTGFLSGTFIVPQIVLEELQNIANSSDPMRRQRGRHGLDVLNKLKQERDVIVTIVDDNPPDVDAVDAKLVEIAKEYGAPLMTNDFNLNGVAGVHGITVLNLNELALALQPDLLPGEMINVQIISEGREQGQGVGYLKDGTMIVVEGGKRYLDRTINVVITRYIRSSAGKMYFGVHEKDAENTKH